jgi:hypothetical protein
VKNGIVSEGKEVITSELTVSIGINFIVLSFFAGVYVCTIKNHGKAIEDLHKNQSKAIEDLKTYFNDKVADMKADFERHLKRVEDKQDKHNNLIERTYCIEKCISVLQEQVNVENHRIKDLEEVQHDCILKRGK